MSETNDKSELQKAIRHKHAELNAVVDAAIEKCEKINEAEIMRISIVPPIVKTNFLVF